MARAALHRNWMNKIGLGLLGLMGTFLILEGMGLAVVTPSQLGGNYPGAQTITLSSNEAATIYYTLDSTDPTTSDTRIQYSEPISISTAKVLKYYALDASGNASAVETQFYTIYAINDSWTPKADFGGMARRGAVGFSIGSKGYVGTGGDNSWQYKDFWEYDPVLNVWTQKADLEGAARRGAVGFSIASKGYIGMGWDGVSYIKDFWEYDPVLNTWMQKADFAGMGRYAAVAFPIGAKGYVGTGYDGSVYYKDFWEYDPSQDTWTQRTDFVDSARWGAAGFSIGNKGYVGTGYDGSVYYKDFWEYDPGADTWTRKAYFGGTIRISPIGFSIGTKGYIGTGYDGSSFYKDLWEYDPATNTWTQKADSGGTDRVMAVGFSIGNRGYVGTGAAGLLYYRDFSAFDPASYLSLYPGWNFISLPLTPPDAAIGQVLASVSSKTVIAWGYDNSTKIWRKWTPAGGTANTLPTMEPGKGYWIYMSDVASLDISSWSALISPSVTLSGGWNLVGYGGFDGKDVAAVLGGFSGGWSVAWMWENGQWYGKLASLRALPASILPLSIFIQKKAFWIKIAPGSAVNWAQ